MSENQEITRLAEQAKAGNREAFSRLYELTYQDKYYIAKKYLKNPTDAEDVLQDAYVSAFTHLDQLQDPAKFSSWLGMIVANRAKNLLQKKNPMLFTDMVTEDESDGEDPLLRVEDTHTDTRPEEAYLESERSELIRGLMDGLTDEQRTCVMMFYLEELSLKEIAASLDTNENTIKSRLFKARKALNRKAEEMKKHGYVFSVAPLHLLICLLRNGKTSDGTTVPPWQPAAADLQAAAKASVDTAAKAAAGKSVTAVSGNVIGETLGTAAAKATVSTVAKAAAVTAGKSVIGTKIAAIALAAVVVVSGGVIGTQVIRKNAERRAGTAAVTEEQVPVTTEKETPAATEPETEEAGEDWQKGYRDFLREHAEEYDGFTLLWLDEDDIPELLCVKTGDSARTALFSADGTGSLMELFAAEGDVRLSYAAGAGLVSVENGEDEIGLYLYRKGVWEVQVSTGIDWEEETFVVNGTAVSDVIYDLAHERAGAFLESYGEAFAEVTADSLTPLGGADDVPAADSLVCEAAHPEAVDPAPAVELSVVNAEVRYYIRVRQEDEQTWKQGYADFLSDAEIIGDIWDYRLVWINDDAVPELCAVVSSPYGQGRPVFWLYKYDEGDVCPVYNNIQERIRYRQGTRLEFHEYHTAFGHMYDEIFFTANANYSAWMGATEDAGWQGYRLTVSTADGSPMTDGSALTYHLHHGLPENQGYQSADLTEEQYTRWMSLIEELNAPETVPLSPLDVIVFPTYQTVVPPMDKSSLPFDDPDALFEGHTEDRPVMSMEERLRRRAVLKQLQDEMDALLKENTHSWGDGLEPTDSVRP